MSTSSIMLERIADYFYNFRERNKYDLRFWFSIFFEFKEFLSHFEYKETSTSNNNTVMGDRLDKKDILKLLIDVFEASVEALPTCGILWRLYGEALILFSSPELAAAAYERGIQQTSSLELFISYINFTYQRRKVIPLLDALTLAAQKIGCDLRSQAIWIELISLRTQLYFSRNAISSTTENVPSTSGCQTPMHQSGPFSNLEAFQKPSFLTTFKSSREVLSCIPGEGYRLFSDGFLASIVQAALLERRENLIKTNEDNNEDQTRSTPYGLTGTTDRLIEEQSFDRLRSAYRNWLSTPTDSVGLAFAAYSAFEKSLVSTSNTGSTSSSHWSLTGLSTSASQLLTTRMIAAAKTTSTTTMKVHKRLKAKDMWGGFTTTLGDIGSWETPAMPPQPSTLMMWNVISSRWKRILRYESTNPIGLSISMFRCRIIALYECCLATCGFQAEFWLMYFQELLTQENVSAGVAKLQCAIDRFLPDDELIQLILADFYLTRGNRKSAEKILLFMVLRATHPLVERHKLLDALSTVLGRHIEELASSFLLSSSHALIEEAKPQESKIQSSEDSETETSSTTTLLHTQTDINLSSASTQAKPACSSVGLLHLLNFYRIDMGIAFSHAVFLALHHFGSKHLYLYHARQLWIQCRQADLSCEVLRLSLKRFQTDVEYIISHGDLLLEMGFLEECRRHLLKSALETFKVTLEPSLPIWNRIFDIETIHGNNTEYRLQLESIFAQQMSGINSEKRSLVINSADTSSFHNNIQQTSQTDTFTSPLMKPHAIARHVACLPEPLILSPTTTPASDTTSEDTLKFITTVSAAAGITDHHKINEINEQFRTLRLLYHCGRGVRTLFNMLSVGSCHPETSIFERSKKTQSRRVFKRSEVIDNESYGTAYTKTFDDEDESSEDISSYEDDFAKTDLTTTMVPAVSTSTTTIIRNMGYSKLLPSTRPDTSVMVPFNPLINSALPYPPQTTLRNLVFGIDEEAGGPDDYPINTSPATTKYPIPLPPILINFLALLPPPPTQPSGLQFDFNFKRLVDYSIHTLQTVVFPKISPSELMPLPTQTLALHSTLLPFNNQQPDDYLGRASINANQNDNNIDNYQQIFDLNKMSNKNHLGSMSHAANNQSSTNIYRDRSRKLLARSKTSPIPVLSPSDHAI